MDKIYWKDLVKEYLQIAGYFKVIDIENIPNYSKEFLEKYLAGPGVLDAVKNLDIIKTSLFNHSHYLHMLSVYKNTCWYFFKKIDLHIICNAELYYKIHVWEFI